ncbi:oxidation resistance protein 1 isoform X4 [Aphis craccivora]|uniref:Oxidation resistance protein 1 isoform X4 n=1 Tax=Aphis craccivora TaxID=307492 RepID=A0A6G0ZMP9_APHCR|nr:oxidation resistance protein 1 isoform X4 [Aphis craccivora]
MEDLYISSATAESCTNNNIEEDSPKKKWNRDLAILQETTEDCGKGGEDSGGGGGGKPPMSPPERRHRRKSWQMGRLDKKRRKSVSVLSPIPDAEQLETTARESAYYKSKRPSWWNIFAHDNWAR